MIKVNLARGAALGTSRVSATDASSAGASATPAFSGEGNPRKRLMQNFGVILLPLALLYLVDVVMTSSKEGELKAAQAKLAQVDKQITALGDDSQLVEAALVEQAKLDENLKEIQVLSENRLLSIKALDAIQTLIPERTWIKGVSIKDKELKLEGISMTIEEYLLFSKALDESIYFTRVRTEKKSEEKSPEGSTFHKFEFITQVEEQL